MKYLIPLMFLLTACGIKKQQYWEWHYIASEPGQVYDHNNR